MWELLNVDVLFRLYSADRRVHERAIEAHLGEARVSRHRSNRSPEEPPDNLHGLSNKQNELGRAQLALATEVVQQFMHESTKRLRVAKAVEKLARSDAGKKVTKRYGIHVADAIEPRAIHKNFHAKKLPQLLRLMSESRRIAFSEG